MRTTPLQQRVLDLMEQGYELGNYHGIYSSITLQLGGLGYGGKTEKVNRTTFWSMLEKGLIVESENRAVNLTVYKTNK